MKADVIKFTGEITKTRGVKCSFCGGEFEINSFVREHRDILCKNSLYRFCEECYDKVLDEVETNLELDVLLLYWTEAKKGATLTEFIYDYKNFTVGGKNVVL